MKLSIVPFLRCPDDGRELKLVDPVWNSNKTEIIEGKLVSPAGRAYGIREGVPVLLSGALVEAGQAETARSFSQKWERAGDYRNQTRAHYQRWYLERYGFGDLATLKTFLGNKRFILDAGTGMGRDSEMYASNSNAQVFGIDLSEGIFQANSDLAHIPNLHLIQADLTRLPFSKNFFDFIACDQVIHHTQDTHASLIRLLEHLGNGHIAIYTYKKKAPAREFCDDFIRAQTVGMSPEDCWKFSESMTKIGQALSELDVKIQIPVDLPILELKAGEHDLQRWIYWNFFKCYWNAEIDWNSNVLTNFDWYHPLYAHRHTPEEVRSWFGQAGLVIDNFSVVESGISVLGHRPNS